MSSLQVRRNARHDFLTVSHFRFNFNNEESSFPLVLRVSPYAYSLYIALVSCHKRETQKNESSDRRLVGFNERGEVLRAKLPRGYRGLRAYLSPPDFITKQISRQWRTYRRFNRTRDDGHMKGNRVIVPSNVIIPWGGRRGVRPRVTWKLENEGEEGVESAGNINTTMIMRRIISNAFTIVSNYYSIKRSINLVENFPW